MVLNKKYQSEITAKEIFFVCSTINNHELLEELGHQAQVRKVIAVSSDIEFLDKIANNLDFTYAYFEVDTSSAIDTFEEMYLQLEMDQAFIQMKTIVIANSLYSVYSVYLIYQIYFAGDSMKHFALAYFGIFDKVNNLMNSFQYK